MTKVRAKRAFYEWCLTPYGMTAAGRRRTTQRHAADTVRAVVPSQSTSGVKHWLGEVRYAAAYPHSLPLAPVFLANHFY